MQGQLRFRLPYYYIISNLHFYMFRRLASVSQRLAGGDTKDEG